MVNCVGGGGMKQGNIEEAYHHIEAPTVLTRKDGKYAKKRSMTKFSSEEFRLLNKNFWYAKRKYDGTNMRIYWDGNRAVWNGKTNKFTPTKEIAECMDNLISEEVFEEVFGRKEVMIFGELMGEGIQGNELGIKGLKLIVFDIKIGGIWLQPEDILAISENMGLEACDFVGFGSLEQLIQRIHDGFYRGYEGIVVEPAGRFRDCKGNRIICKIKNRDYFEE